MANSSKEIINSVGIEMEFMNVNRNDRLFVQKFRNILANYKIEHDASCETPVQSFLNYPITFKNKKAKQTLSKFTHEIIIGGEIISPILNTLSPAWISEIHQLCQILTDHGEKDNTIRDSFHVHVNLSKEVPLFVLQNLLRFCLAYEAFLFRLGGMGRKNRGEENQFIFCRPYLGNGPPVVKYNRRNHPILSLPKLLNSTSKEEFFHNYGDSINCVNSGIRYVTQRYMCVNFFPILTQGSIEFRTANKTLNPNYIIAWTNFCKAIVTKSFSETNLIFDKTRPLAENKNIQVNEFLDAITILNLDEVTLNILKNIWETSPNPKFDNNWRYSHLEDPTSFRQIENATPALSIKTKISKPNYINVRNVNRQNQINLENEVEIVNAIPPRIQREPNAENIDLLFFHQERNPIIVNQYIHLWERLNEHYLNEDNDESVILNPLINMESLQHDVPITNTSQENYLISITKNNARETIKVKLLDVQNNTLTSFPAIKIRTLINYGCITLANFLDIARFIIWLKDEWELD